VAPHNVDGRCWTLFTPARTPPQVRPKLGLVQLPRWTHEITLGSQSRVISRGNKSQSSVCEHEASYTARLRLVEPEPASCVEPAVRRAGIAVLAVCALLVALWSFNRDVGTEPLAPLTLNPESPPPTVKPTSAAVGVEPRSEPDSKPLRMEPNIVTLVTGRPLPDVESPPWSDEMESTILSHIGQHPGLKLTNLQVQCAEEGCLILLIGRDIPVYELDLDVFATEHGFNAALIRGDGIEDRTVFLRR